MLAMRFYDAIHRFVYSMFKALILLTLIRITEITYIVVFQFTFCKRFHNKKFPFVYGAIIVKKLIISTKSNSK